VGAPPFPRGGMQSALLSLATCQLSCKRWIAFVRCVRASACGCAREAAAVARVHALTVRLPSNAVRPHCISRCSDAPYDTACIKDGASELMGLYGELQLAVSALAEEATSGPVLHAARDACAVVASEILTGGTNCVRVRGLGVGPVGGCWVRGVTPRWWLLQCESASSC
jgi:hypothetical protein